MGEQEKVISTSFDTVAASTSPIGKSKTLDSPSQHSKPCDLCNAPKDVLVRCQIDETHQWRFVCPGKCWRLVSGGEVDGPDKPFYRYGGMWKNKHEGVSAKRPKHKSREPPKAWVEKNMSYVNNDRVTYDSKLWICRRSHNSNEKKTPEKAYRYWKEVDKGAEDYEDAKMPECPRRPI